MSSARNDSVEVLRGMLMGLAMSYESLHARFRVQGIRLWPIPDQTGALTAEQRNLDDRVLAVSGAFMATVKQMVAVNKILGGFLDLQPQFQRQLRDQITASFPSIIVQIGVMLRDLERQVQELECTLYRHDATGTLYFIFR